MKGRRQSRHTKKKSVKGWIGKYIILTLVVFLVSATASYLYFKPKFMLVKPVTPVEQRPANYLSKRHKVPERLYRPVGKDLMIIEETEGLRRNNILAVAEEAIKRHIKPYGADLLDLYMDKEGIIYIDLSNGLRKGFRGDALEEYSIIVGLYRVLKEEVPDFKAFKLLIEGRETESFGGHLSILRPIGEVIESGL